MIAVDLSKDVIVPSSVAIVGALAAGISAIFNSWFENRDARRKADRQLDLARRRVDFVNEWVTVSSTLDANDADAEERAEQRADDVARARKELTEAADEAAAAFHDAKTDTSTVLRELRRLLMLVRRRNLASYVVAGLFLFVSVFAWLVICIPQPGGDSFSVITAILLSLSATIALRLVAELVVTVLERASTSDAQTITRVAVKDDVATITTKAAHGLSADQEVIIDASNDTFDGRVTVTSVTKKTFSFPLRVADVRSASVTGWVCGEAVAEQLKRLALVPRGRRVSTYVVSGLFFVSLLAFSAWVINTAQRDLDRAGYPNCVGESYAGSYFGVADPFFTEDADTATLRADVDGAINFLRDEVPLWTPSKSPIEITNHTETNSGSWLLVDTQGDEYVLDEDGDLYYKGERTVLYAKAGDLRLKKLGEPCDPQPLSVRTTKVRESQFELFNFYDDSDGYLTAEKPTFVYPGKGTGTTRIDVYYGRDGRLIPVCNTLEYPEIQPCLDRSNAYYDSGLDAWVTRVFWVGLQILGFAILSRLLFGFIASGFQRRNKRQSAAPPEGLVP